MRVFGLTGGIASGKSTVHTMFTALGAHVLDADAIYHRLITPVDGASSPLTARIEKRFPGVVRADGSLDRAALGRIVFANTSDRRDLEHITHPEVGAQFAREVQALADRGVDHVLYDVPLLYERDLQKGMDGVVVVWVPRDIQRARLMARDGIDASMADTKLASQLPLDDKRARATWVIDNSGTLGGTQRQVENVWRTIAYAP